MEDKKEPPASLEWDFNANHVTISTKQIGAYKRQQFPEEHTIQPRIMGIEPYQLGSQRNK